MASVEAYLVACEPKASAWCGGEGGGGVFASGSRAERKSGTRIDEFDEALMRWHYGSDHPRVREAVWAVLMAVCSQVAVDSGQRWPHGAMQGLVSVAMAELWRRHERLTHDERRILMTNVSGWTELSESTWYRIWAGRYKALYGEALRRIGRAELVAAR